MYQRHATTDNPDNADGEGVSPRLETMNPQPTSFVKFEISDSGLGIPEDKLPYIFNLFESDLMAIHNMQGGH